MGFNALLGYLCLQDCYLVYILTEMTGCTSMVFTRTADSTRFLAVTLRKLGLRAIPISGQMSQVYTLFFPLYIQFHSNGVKLLGVPFFF